jgi:hypothetical protein
MMSNSDKMEKFVKFDAGWDKRDADPSKNYGISGLRITFFYGNSKYGYVQFVILTDWYPTCLDDEAPGLHARLAGCYPMAADVGYHSPHPMYQDHSPFECDLIDGGQCYYDGSGLHAEEVMKKLRNEGSDAVWEHLEGYWNDMFLGQEEPRANQNPDLSDRKEEQEVP